MIKNIKDLKKCQIVCRNKQDVENCLNMLEELGFEVRNNDNQYQVIFYSEHSNLFENDVRLECGVDTYFYNKNFIKTLQKIIKEKEEREKEEDFEVAEDGRIIKVNNWDSDKYLYFLSRWDNTRVNFTTLNRQDIEYYVNIGLVFASKEARDRALFKLEIETKLKNLAERLNKKIFHVDSNLFENNVIKYNLSIEYINSFEKILHCYGCGNNTIQDQGVIYCLDKNFLEVAKKEIGEEKLIKYFKEQ